MKLPSFRRLFTADYEQQFKKLIETLSVSLNQGIEVLYEMSNKNVSLSDNVKCTVKDVTFQVDSNGTPITSTSFVLDIPGRILGISTINALNQTNSTVYPVSGIQISFTQNNTIVTITNVTGLQVNNTYLVRLIAWNQ